MNSSALFRAFVLSSAVSVSLSFSALSIGGEDFKNAKLEKEWEEAGEVVRKKITDSQDLDTGLQAARKIEEIANDTYHETSHNFLLQILGIEKAYASGSPEQQDSQTLSGFKAQIQRVFKLYQKRSLILQKLTDKSRILTLEEHADIVRDAEWLKDNFPQIQEARKIMARAFFLRRVGYNSHHKETAFDVTWKALSNVKKLELILKTLKKLGKDSEISRVYGIIPETRPEDIVLTRKQLDNLPSYLLDGFPEFEVSPSVTYSLPQLHALKEDYKSPASILWCGDNQTILNAKEVMTLSQIQALRDLGMEIEADDALREVFALQGRQRYHYEINIRVLGRLNESANEAQEISTKIKSAKKQLHQFWSQHMLGYTLQPSEAIPNQKLFNEIMEILHYQAATRFTLENDQLDQESISYLYESIQVRLAEIQLRNERIYDRALKGDKIAFAKVCSWGEYINESNAKFFSPGDKLFFDEFNGPNASKEEKERFERIIIGIYSVLGQKELKKHPEYSVWKLATEEDRTTEEITQNLLHRLKNSKAQLEREWRLSRSPSIQPLLLDMTQHDQADVRVWEEAYAQLQKEGTQATEESRKLHRIVFGYPYEQAIKALTQHTKKNFFYSIIESVRGCLQASQDSAGTVLLLLGNKKSFLTNMMQCMSENDVMVYIEGEPHLKAQWEIIQKIWGYVSDDKLNLQLQANEIFALAQKVSAYKIDKDLGYSQGLVRLWWDKRPNASLFQGKKRVEDDLLFLQFLTAGLQMNFLNTEPILKKLWNADKLESKTLN